MDYVKFTKLMVAGTIGFVGSKIVNLVKEEIEEKKRQKKRDKEMEPGMNEFLERIKKRDAI